VGGLQEGQDEADDDARRRAARRCRVAGRRCPYDLKWFDDQVAAFGGGRVLGKAEYDGLTSDLTLIYEAAGQLYVMGFKDGCRAGGPFALDVLATPAPPPRAPPVVPEASV
jgi:hypothetical protein